MRSRVSGEDRRGAPEPLGPEEIELTGLEKALRYEAAKQQFERTEARRDGDAYLEAWLALEDHVNDHHEPVETATAMYKVGPDGSLQTLPGERIDIKALIRPAIFGEILRV